MDPSLLIEGNPAGMRFHAAVHCQAAYGKIIDGDGKEDYG
jgi:hypothetical protein